MPNFAAWAHDTLAQFAAEAAKKLREQELEIEQLRQERRDAIDAYRSVLKQGGSMLATERYVVGHVQHASDCSVHNMPAYPAGPCDCGAKK